MFKKIVIFSLLVLLFSSCIKEDLSECVLRLELCYTYNKSEQNQLEQVRDIRVYIFGSNEVLFDVVRATQQDIVRGYIDLVLPDDTYTIVAWGASSTDMVQGGYQIADMSDPTSDVYSQVSIGTTTLNSFRTLLSTVPLSGDVLGDVAPQKEQFDDLFYAIVSDFTVIKGRKQTILLDFMKNTSILKVKITGLQYLTSSQPLDVFATARNERYMYNNRIDPSARVIRHKPSGTTTKSTEMTVDIKVQRLLIAMQNAAPAAELHITHPQLGINMATKINLLYAILNTKDNTGNNLWASQEAIDKEDEFLFEISIAHNLSVTVTLNDFEFITVIPGL
jgi:hypothetical protein